MILKSGGVSIVGKHHEVNQDCFKSASFDFGAVVAFSAVIGIGIINRPGPFKIWTGFGYYTFWFSEVCNYRFKSFRQRQYNCLKQYQSE